MIDLVLNRNNFRIVDIWEDGWVYVQVEVAPDLYVDVVYPDNSTELSVLESYQSGDVPYSFPLDLADGGWVYDYNSNGYRVANISEDDSWEVVQFVDDEFFEHGEDYLC